jgi:hypothetical protein
VLFFCLAAAVIPLLADDPDPHRISGRVVTASGIPLSGAAVLLNDTPFGEVGRTKTSADGRFEFPGVAPGRYFIETTKPGFIPTADMVWLDEKDVHTDDIEMDARLGDKSTANAVGSPALTIDRIEDNRRTVITLSNGSTVVPPKQDYQATVSEPAIADDRRAAGWLVEYWTPSSTSGRSIPLTLVIYRPGKPLRRFSAEPVFWTWWFVDGGKRVGYCENSLHPGPSPPLCELRDVETGRKIDQYVPSGGKPPEWAENVPE